MPDGLVKVRHVASGDTIVFDPDLIRGFPRHPRRPIEVERVAPHPAGGWLITDRKRPLRWLKPDGTVESRTTRLDSPKQLIRLCCLATSRPWGCSGIFSQPRNISFRPVFCEQVGGFPPVPSIRRLARFAPCGAHTIRAPRAFPGRGVFFFEPFLGRPRPSLKTRRQRDNDGRDHTHIGGRLGGVRRHFHEHQRPGGSCHNVDRHRASRVWRAH